MIELCALVLTYDEAPNIARCLYALRWVPRVLLVDSFSSDETAALATASHPNVSIVRRAFDTYAGQCNFGLTQIETEWVLSIDADYIFPPELGGEIQQIEPEPAVAGYSARFRYCIFRRRLRATIYPQRTVLYRRQTALYRDEGHGHRVQIAGPIVPLRFKIDHDDRKPLSRWIRSQDRYSIVEATHLLATRREELTAVDRLRLRVFLAPVIMPVYLLLGRGLCFDGWAGWYYASQRTIAELLLSLRLLTIRYGLEEDA